MVGGSDYKRPPVQPRHPGPAPARLGVQAVHPRRGAEEGLRPGSRLAVAQARLQRPDTGGKEKFVVNNYDNAYSGARTLGRRDRSPTTRCSPRSASRSGTKRIAQLASGWASARRSRRNYAMTLGGSRRASRRWTWRTPTRRSPTGGERVCGTLGAPRRGPGRHPGGRARRAPTRSLDAQQASDRKRVLSAGARRTETVQQMQTVVSSGTGKRAAYRRVRRRQDRHHRELRRRLVRRLHRQMTVAVWVGYPDRLEADEDRVPRRARSRAAPSPR